ncbi:MAG: energy transducer TonB [Planctomycetes bacterium]|nr:energy transducer TonB [Planctomycetota bacterium]
MACRLPSPPGRSRPCEARSGRRGWGLAWDPAAEGDAGAGSGGGSAGGGEAGEGGGSGIGRRSGGKTPEYPRLAREEGWEGTASIELLVTDRGEVAEARLAKSSGHQALDEAALEAARTWTFEPARKGGIAVAARVRMPVTFRLTD